MTRVAHGRRADEGLPAGWDVLDRRGLASATSVLQLALMDELGDKVDRAIVERLVAKVISAYTTTVDYFNERERAS